MQPYQTARKRNVYPTRGYTVNLQPCVAWAEPRNPCSMLCVLCAFLQSETCNLPSGPAGWLANAKTTAALPGPSLANTLAHTVQESHRPYTTWQTKRLLTRSCFVTSRPPANRGPSVVPLLLLSPGLRFLTLMRRRQTVPSPPSHLRVLKCPLTHSVKSVFNTVADLASIVISASLSSVCSECFP